MEGAPLPPQNTSHHHDGSLEETTAMQDIKQQPATNVDVPNGVEASPAEASTPKKRSRGKYASRACVQCRSRKLKCDGQDPCHRCSRRSHQCVYSDDRAVNEILRRTRQQLLSGNMNGSVPIEARVQRLEVAMQAVTERLHCEDLQAKPDIGPEPHHDPAEQSNNFQGETAFRSPVHTFHQSLSNIKQRMGITQDLNNPADSLASTRASRPSEASAMLRREENFSQIRIGSKTLTFPSPEEYRRYLDYIFVDINPCHPCLNESDFRARSARMLGNAPINRCDACFLALHYILFACVDILQDVSGPDEIRPSPGWTWYQAADELVGKSKFHGAGDLSLIQSLIFEAFYLTHEDKPNAAYNISGLACRLCYQFGLHQQSRWEESESSYQVHMKQRILWTAYFVDRRIALSCGRPFGMNDSDIKVGFPAYVDDRELQPDAPLPPDNTTSSFLPYMACMIQFARFSGEIWEKVFSASAVDKSGEEVAVLDTRLSHWSEHELPKIPLLPPNGQQPTVRHVRQHILVHTRVAHLRLLLRRRLMVSLNYSAHDGRLCGTLAMDIVHLVARRSCEATEASSFRFHMAVSLSGALLILGTLLCRRLSEVGLQDSYPAYADSFRRGLAMLREIGTGLFAARRVLEDLRETITFVTALIDQPTPTPQQPLMRMPSNMEQLFPYGAVDFNHQHGAGYPYESVHQTNGVRQNAGYHESGWNGWEGANSEMQQQGNGYGVPWI